MSSLPSACIPPVASPGHLAQARSRNRLHTHTTPTLATEHHHATGSQTLIATPISRVQAPTPNSRRQSAPLPTSSAPASASINTRPHTHITIEASAPCPARPIDPAILSDVPLPDGRTLCKRLHVPVGAVIAQTNADCQPTENATSGGYDGAPIGRSPTASTNNPQINTVSPASNRYFEFQSTTLTNLHTITLQVICIPREAP